MTSSALLHPWSLQGTTSLCRSLLRHTCGRIRCLCRARCIFTCLLTPLDRWQSSWTSLRENETVYFTARLRRAVRSDLPCPTCYKILQHPMQCIRVARVPHLSQEVVCLCTLHKIVGEILNSGRSLISPAQRCFPTLLQLMIFPTVRAAHMSLECSNLLSKAKTLRVCGHSGKARRMLARQGYYVLSSVTSQKYSVDI